LRQTWHDVLFAHWAVDPRTVRSRIPSELQLDVTADGAWLGIVAFEITGLRPRGVPRLPGVSSFPEVNVRTYVRLDDRPGVYFFSLDAGSRLAVHAARRALHLPYHRAAMAIERRGNRVRFSSDRDAGLVRARLDVLYGPSGDVFRARPGTLEHLLIERYCLFARDDRRQLYRLDIHHPPWVLQAAEAELRIDTLIEALGITTPRAQPLLHYAARQDVLAWWPTTT
jgi:uncharacterized protein YqjF (DUF2071 family)